MRNNEKEKVYKIFKDVGFYNARQNKRVKSARLQDAIKCLPEAIAKTRNPLLPTLENEEDSSDLQREGVKLLYHPTKSIYSLD